MANGLAVSLRYVLGVRESEICMLDFKNGQRAGQVGNISEVEERKASRCVNGCLWWLK